MYDIETQSHDSCYLSVEASEQGRVSEELMSAQASTLLVAGAETSSTALCRILHLLALHPIVQDTLRKEINEALSSDGNGMDALEYEKLMALPFLDAVCKETLRVFAPAPCVIAGQLFFFRHPLCRS